MADTAELIARLRKQAEYLEAYGEWNVPPRTLTDAATALETLQSENVDLERRLSNICLTVHTCSGDACERPVCVLRREIERLRESESNLVKQINGYKDALAQAESDRPCCAGGPQWGHALTCPTLP